MQAGLLSREMRLVRDAHVVGMTEGNTDRGVMRESRPGPARSENLSMYGIFMRENREVPRLPARMIAGRDARGRPRPQA